MCWRTESHWTRKSRGVAGGEKVITAKIWGRRCCLLFFVWEACMWHSFGGDFTNSPSHLPGYEWETAVGCSPATQHSKRDGATEGFAKRCVGFTSSPFEGGEMMLWTGAGSQASPRPEVLWLWSGHWHSGGRPGQEECRKWFDFSKREEFYDLLYLLG